MSKGNLFIVSAPSGTGKTTILKEILNSVAGVSFSVSHTTRSPRQGEKDGVDYHFVSREDFLALQKQGTFLEWAEVHDNLYGTSRQEVEKTRNTGEDIILDIDTQGAGQIKNGPATDAIFVFIAPPSWEVLESRLTSRGTESIETIHLRLQNAREEINKILFYDYIVVNDLIEDAVDMLRAIILAERSRKKRSITGTPLPISLLSGHEEKATN